MRKVIKSITLDSKVLADGIERAKKERRSFSSLVEYLLDMYLKKNVEI